jgi:RND family efflux transporter MFP subunit
MAPMARRWAKNQVYLGGVLGLVAAAIVAGIVVHGRYAEVAVARDNLASMAAQGPRVQVVTATKSPDIRDIRLLGDARPDTSATLFSKVSGYLKSISVDKGDQVKAGQVLAEIDSAETDALYDAAVADLANKRKVAGRDRDLLTRGNVALQQQEQSDTNLLMAEQSVRNLATLKSYEIIRAPFDGTVTARYADPGALMPAATTNQATSLPVVTLSDISKLRIGVYVEQRDAPFVHVGDAADVTDAADAERTVHARISRTSGALDPKTRTLYLEIDVDNSQNLLVAGSFVYATLHLQVKSYPQIPVSALIVRGDQSYVAAVGDDSLVKFRSVRLAGTDGDTVAIADGVQPGDRLAINLPPEVADGSRIQPILASK